MFFDILHDQAVIVIHLHGVGHCLDDALDSSLFFKVIALIHEVFLFQKVNDDIIQVKDHKLKIIIAPVIPINAEKPKDARIKSGRYIKTKSGNGENEDGKKTV